MSAVRLATDNDFNEHIANGVRERLPTVELISIRDVGLGSAADPVILNWAATAGYAVVTHDASTMPAAAYDRLRRGDSTPGLVLVPQRLPIGEAVRRLVELLSQAEQDDLDGHVTYV